MNKLLVFLGNPGSQYRSTRHNFGFMVCDRLGENNWQNKFHGSWCKNNNAIILKPKTFMNESGISVREASDFFHIPPKDIVVFHDDTELNFSKVQLEMGGGMRGHNGLRSIRQHLGTDAFQRVRLGIGRPIGKQDLASFVLGGFSESEKSEISDILEQACKIAEQLISIG